MELKFTPNAWEDYQSWENENKIRKKINVLIKYTMRTPFERLGKPGQLKHQLSGLWSRKIDNEHRLVYSVENDVLILFSCRHHY